MNFTALLDTAIGLSLVYLGAALFVTILNESIARVFELRGRALKIHLKQLFDQTGLHEAVQKSTLIAPVVKVADDKLGKLLAKMGGHLVAGVVDKPVQKLGSYVDPVVLAQVILGQLAPPAMPPAPPPAPGGAAPPVPAAAAMTMRKALEEIVKLPDSSVKSLLWSSAAAAKDDVEKFTKSVGVWLDKSLHMLGDNYKRWIQLISFGLGVIIAVAANIDTIELTRRLYTDKALRDATVASAEQFTRSTTPEVFKKCTALGRDALEKDPSCAAVVALADSVRRSQSAQLPIGWQDAKTICGKDQCCVGNWGLRLLGWLLTALALSLGAPFWFDLLNRFVNLRGASRKEGEAKSS